MNKIYKLLLIASLALLMPFSALNVVKADATDGWDVGKKQTGYGHNTYCYWTWEYNEILVTNGVVKPSSEFYVHIELLEVCDGQMIITINGINTFADYAVLTTGAQINQVSSNQVQLQMYESNIIDVHFYSTKVYITNQNWNVTVSFPTIHQLGSPLEYMTSINSFASSISLSLIDVNSGINSIINSLSDIEDALALIETSHDPNYNIPLVNFNAWIFAKNTFNQVEYATGDVYPHLTITDQALSRIVNIPAKSSVEFIFYANQTFTTSGNYHVSANNQYFQTTTKQLNDYRLAGYTLYSIKIENVSDSAQSGRLTYWLASDIVMIPVYFGIPDGMPEDIYKMIYGKNLSEQFLEQIVSLLNTLTGNTYDDTEANDLNDDLNDINDDINDVTDVIDYQFDISISNIDLSDYDYFDNITNTSTYFRTYLDQYFLNLRDLKAVIIIPIIVTVFLLLVGWLM